MKYQHQRRKYNNRKIISFFIIIIIIIICNIIPYGRSTLTVKEMNKEIAYKRKLVNKIQDRHTRTLTKDELKKKRRENISW